MEAGLNTPLDPLAIATEVAADALLASKVYLASVLVIGEAGFLEHTYLDHLAGYLGLVQISSSNWRMKL